MVQFIDTSGHAFYILDGDAFVLPDVTVWFENTPVLIDFLPETQVTLQIDGAVLGSGTATVDLGSTSAATADSILVGTTGVVRCGQFAGIFMSGDGQRLVNDGQISGSEGIIFSSGQFGSIGNSGIVTGTATGSAAVDVQFSSFSAIANDGTVRGYSGIGLANTSFATILNTGLISATNASGFGIDVIGTSAETTILNAGQITAPSVAIRGGEQNETVENTGEILGSIELHGGDDVVRGRAGMIAGAIYGGNGNDVIRSGTGDDSVQGDEGNDLLRGNAGDDLLFGGKSSDVLRGDTGDDTLDGGSGKDDFVFARGDGQDSINGFADGQDQIDLSAIHFASFAAVAALASDRAGGMLIDLSDFGGGTIFVAGFLKLGFDAGDVIL